MSKNKHYPDVNLSRENEVILNLEDENRFMEWISKNGRYLGYAFAVVMILALVLFRISSGNKAQAEQDFINADKEYAKLESHLGDNTLFDEDLAKLRDILHRHPELHAKYDAKIAQMLIFDKRPAEAQHFADETFSRTKSLVSPYYTEYSQTTLLIADKNYQAALEKSQGLKNKMINANGIDKDSFGDVLYALNLLRIVSLQQQIGSKSDELVAWQEFQQYAKNIKESGEKLRLQALAGLMNQFSEGKVTLTDYVESQKLVK